MPMLIGGTVLGAIAWVSSFILTVWAVKGWRLHRAKRLLKAAQRAAGAKKRLIQTAKCGYLCDLGMMRIFCQTV
jgi:hypothetical protein